MAYAHTHTRSAHNGSPTAEHTPKHARCPNTHATARSAHAHMHTRAHAHTRTRAHAHTPTRPHVHTRTRAHAHTRTLHFLYTHGGARRLTWVAQPSCNAARCSCCPVCPSFSGPSSPPSLQTLCAARHPSSHVACAWQSRKRRLSPLSTPSLRRTRRSAPQLGWARQPHMQAAAHAGCRLRFTRGVRMWRVLWLAARLLLSQPCGEGALRGARRNGCTRRPRRMQL